ncbi:MAG: DUF397 domain-containing protein [Actinoallomurus sp.]
MAFWRKSSRSESTTTQSDCVEVAGISPAPGEPVRSPRRPAGLG